jgi:hypothetical protein
MKVSAWLPLVAAFAAAPLDVAWNRPAAASFVAFAAVYGAARLAESSAIRRRVGAWSPGVHRHFAFAFAYPTRRRKHAGLAVLTAIAAVGVSQMQLRRGQLGFLRPVAADVKGIDYALTYVWRAVALFGTGAVVGFGARWIHLREAQAAVRFDAGALRAAAESGNRGESVKQLTNRFFAPGWESRWREELDGVKELFDSEAFRAAAKCAEEAACAALSSSAASPLRSLTNESEEERLRAALWRRLHDLTPP